jgi:phage regulator Rha-like protein
MFTSTLPSVIEPSFEGIKKLETGVAFRKAIERSRKGKKDIVVIQGFIPFNAELFEPEGIFIDSTFIAELLQVEHRNLLSKINQEVNDFQLLVGETAKILAVFKKVKRKTRTRSFEYYKVESAQALQLMATYATPVGNFMRRVLDAYIRALQEWYKAFETVKGKTVIEARKESKERRRLFTDVLKAWGAKPFDYARATNIGYKNAFGLVSSQMEAQIREAFNLGEKKISNRDYMDAKCLSVIGSYETMAAIAINTSGTGLKDADKIVAKAASISADMHEKFFGERVKFVPTMPTKSLEPKDEPKKLEKPRKEQKKLK